MAKGRVNKSAEISDALKESPNASQREIIAALARRKIKITPAQISNVRRRLAGNRKDPMGNGVVSLPDLQAARRFLHATGGSVRRAKQALETLERLL
jgi:arginine repressor